MPQYTLYDFAARDIGGKEQSLAEYRGKVLLIVNVASECGFTPQYAGLEALQRKYADRGFAVLAFPCNQFGSQEPGTEDEIRQFCESRYGVTFQLFAKIDVNGPRTHPLYAFLKSAEPGLLGTEGIKWNFTKFLVAKDGRVVQRYAPTTRPDAIEADIEAQLGRHCPARIICSPFHPDRENMNPKQRDLAQITLGVLFIGGLIAASFWILRPFLPAVIWATMVVVATWPLMLGLQARLWRKRALAVTVMTIGLLLVLVVPLSLAIATLVENADRLVGWGKWLAEFRMPPPPDWVAGLPVVGTRLQQFWQQFAAAGVQEFATKLAPYAGSVTKWFASEVGSFGMVFLQFLLTVVIAAIMYAGGEAAAAWMIRFAQRLAGDRGEQAVVLASQAIRGVALGVVVTALVQSVLGGIGLAVAGVPLAPVLTALMFMLCIAQLGPILVLAPAVAWMYWSGDNAWATFLLVWTLIVGSLDNFLRPFLIKRGADLPLLLILGGVIGGLIAFGLVGIFIGPVVLAVGYTLIDAWVEQGQTGESRPGA